MVGGRPYTQLPTSTRGHTGRPMQAATKTDTNLGPIANTKRICSRGFHTHDDHDRESASLGEAEEEEEDEDDTGIDIVMLLFTVLELLFLTLTISPRKYDRAFGIMWRWPLVRRPLDQERGLALL